MILSCRAKLSFRKLPVNISFSQIDNPFGRHIMGRGSLEMGTPARMSWERCDRRSGRISLQSFFVSISPFIWWLYSCCALPLLASPSMFFPIRYTAVCPSCPVFVIPRANLGFARTTEIKKKFYEINLSRRESEQRGSAFTCQICTRESRLFID